MQLQLTYTINAPINTVWDTFDDPEKLKLWQPSLASLEHCEGEPGQVGAVSKLTFREGEREIVLLETILERRKPHTFTARYSAPMMDSTIANSFTALDGGRTEWAITHQIEFRGAWRILGPLTTGIVRRKHDEDARRFQELVEAEQQEQGGAPKWLKVLSAAAIAVLVLRWVPRRR